jgi:GT2 family glycosyltransferase
MKNIYIVIVNYNGEKDTLDCLNSLKKIYHKNIHLSTIIVDNNPENRINIAENDFSDLNLKIILSSVNAGFSAANNLGIKEALKNNADYILLLNNDTLVKDDFLEKLVMFADKKPEAGLISPKIYFAKGYEFHKDKYKESELGKVIWFGGGKIDWKNVIASHRGVDEVDHGQYDEAVETDFASGCCMLINPKLIEKAGLMKEEYFLYYEDSDYSMRAKREGLKVYYLPDSVIWHKNAGSTGGSGSKLQDYYITRNRLIFGNRFAPLRSKIALNREGIRLVLKGREWQKFGARDFYLHKFGKSIHFE